MKEFKDYFSKSEIVLWSSSVMVIIISFRVFDRINYMTLCASLIGVTSLIFNAKGKSVWTITYGCIQFAVWDYFIYLFVLWGDDYISWNDNADGNFCLNIMAEESV